MKTYFLDRTLKMPLYEQLTEQIKKDIREGLLSAGTKLPSKRKLSDHLRISIQTVETTYDQLVAEGFVYSLPKSGYYVEQDLILQNRPSMNIHHDSFKTVETPPKYSFDLRTNVVDPKMFPLPVWARILKDILANSPSDVWNQSDFRGGLEVREAIAEHLLQFKGLVVHPEQIVLSAGIEHLLPLIVLSIGQEKAVGIENITYKKIARIYQTLGLRIHPLPMDSQGLMSSGLEKKHCDFLHITPSHQFPTGIVMPIKRRLELLRWADRDQNRYIIEDDYDAEFRFVGQPIPTLKSVDELDRVIYLNTFSKTINAGVRLAYMVVPWKLLKIMDSLFSSFNCPVASLEQLALARFLREGHFERHLSRMKVVYRARKEALVSAFSASRLSPYITLYGQDAGLHSLMHVKSTQSGSELAKRAKSVGINFTPIKDYSLDYNSPDSPDLVFGFSELLKEKIPDLLHALEIAWKDLLTDESWQKKDEKA